MLGWLLCVPGCLMAGFGLVFVWFSFVGVLLLVLSWGDRLLSFCFFWPLRSVVVDVGKCGVIFFVKLSGVCVFFFQPAGCVGVFLWWAFLLVVGLDGVVSVLFILGFCFRGVGFERPGSWLFSGAVFLGSLGILGPGVCFFYQFVSAAGGPCSVCSVCLALFVCLGRFSVCGVWLSCFFWGHRF